MDIDTLFNITDQERELYNLYSRMTDVELLDTECVDNICKLVQFERLNNKGNVSNFAAMSISGLMPILTSFPTFDEGLAFIESFKPGFRYTKYFKEFVNSHIKVEEKDKYTSYILGNYSYRLYSDGNQEWYKNGKLHREGDLPAIIYSGGTQIWYKNGKQHREGDLPAFINVDGRQEWYKNGERHRENDLPAIIDANNSQEWYKHGVRHREGDLPAIIDGSQFWYKNGRLHRENDLPAVIIVDGNQYWYKNGVFIK
jgi:antitoxin component YwqK of YwqJK toxin-antitoxin module